MFWLSEKNWPNQSKKNKILDGLSMMAILELEPQQATQAMEHQVAESGKSRKKHQKPEKESSKVE